MATTRKTHAPSLEGQHAIRDAILSLAVRATLTYDESTGRYDNASVKAWLDAQADGLAYGVSVPKTAATVCIKTGANAGVANPVPGTVGTPAVDPYVGRGAFRFFEVNGGVDADGTPYVTAIRGDGRFSRAAADVWILTPVLYMSYSETDTTVELSVSDTKLAGMSIQPQGVLPSGDVRPYMLYAKYPLVTGLGSARSCSGYTPRLFDVSYNSLITVTGSASTGYSGKSAADDWYVKAMFLLKYATKNSQSVFTGATGYYLQYSPSVATASQNHVVLSSADAASLVVGSTLSIGSMTSSGTAQTDKGRGNAWTRDVVDRARVVSIAPYDDSNSKVTLDCAAFSAETSYVVSTMPWHSGACDAVEGDGSPYSCTSGKEPFVIQGIELGHGMYEILSSLTLYSDGSSGWKVMAAGDTASIVANSATTGFTEVGTFPGSSTEGWKYGLYPALIGGTLVQRGTGASQTTGICDGNYKNADTTSGTREWLSLGYLDFGGRAGLWCVGGDWLGYAWWNYGSRLSATGRGGESAA